MNEVNKTLYIPLYGKSEVSKKGIILEDKTAEAIWSKEGFPIKGKAKSKWLCYNMAMRARIFDEWVRSMLKQNNNAMVVHIGCGLDSRCLRVNKPDTKWFDCDFPDVIDTRKKYYSETNNYSMKVLDASSEDDINSLPDASCVIVVLEGISMYLTNPQLEQLFITLDKKYSEIHILLDVYTVFGAKASKYKNPINDVGVTTVYGVDTVEPLLEKTNLKVVAEHSFTPDYLVNELTGFDKSFFKFMFTGKMYSKIYRLFEVATKN